MNEQEATRFLTDLTTELSAEKEYELHHEDYVMEIPQSGERVRGKGNLIAFRKAYPADVEFEVRRNIAGRDVGVSELVILPEAPPSGATSSHTWVHALSFLIRGGEVVAHDILR